MNWLYRAIPLIVVFGLVLLAPFWYRALRNRRAEADEQRTVAHNRRVLGRRARTIAGANPALPAPRSAAGERP